MYTPTEDNCFDSSLKKLFVSVCINLRTIDKRGTKLSDLLEVIKSVCVECVDMHSAALNLYSFGGCAFVVPCSSFFSSFFS